MSLNLKALALTAALIWGGAIFLVGVGNLASPDYGSAFLELIASIYPGYTPAGFGSVIVATLYGMLDGLVAGAIVAWLYNKVFWGLALFPEKIERIRISGPSGRRIRAPVPLRGDMITGTTS